MTMHNARYVKGNVDHTYIPRKKCGRATQSVAKTVNLTNLGLKNYMKESRARFLTAVRSVNIELNEPIQ